LFYVHKALLGSRLSEHDASVIISFPHWLSLLLLLYYFVTFFLPFSCLFFLLVISSKRQHFCIHKRKMMRITRRVGQSFFILFAWAFFYLIHLFIYFPINASHTHQKPFKDELAPESERRRPKKGKLNLCLVYKFLSSCSLYFPQRKLSFKQYYFLNGFEKRAGRVEKKY
jgi:hypothetical protein